MTQFAEESYSEMESDDEVLSDDEDVNITNSIVI